MKNKESFSYLNSRPETRDSKLSGFTLLEILVALAICAGALALILQLFSAGTKNITVSENYLFATLRASEKIQALRLNSQMENRTWTEVSDDGCRTDISIEEVFQDRLAGMHFKLMEIAVVVHWKRGDRDRRYEARTLQLADRGGAGPLKGDGM